MRRSLWIAAVTLVAVACSEAPVAAGPGAVDPTADAFHSTDGKDGANAAEATGNDTEAPDMAAEDTGPDVVDTGPDDVAADIDWSELLDPEDAGPVDTGPISTGPVGELYAHTAKLLYRLDLKTGAFVKIGTFTFNKNPDSVTDLAVDDSGKLFVVTFEDLFECGIETAKCQWIAKLPSPFNALTFVPKGTIDPIADTLIGVSDEGGWNKIAIIGSTVKITELGSYGGGWLSSGDAFSVDTIGTYATLKGKGKTDALAKVDPMTGKATIIGETGAQGLYGLAWWNGVFYAFSSNGNVYTLDVQTGKATVVAGIVVPKDVKWWGAGVSTRAAAK